MFSKLKLVKIKELSGKAASIYSFVLNEDTETAFEKFIEENISTFKSEISDIINRLNVIGKDAGARLIYFKDKEGKPGDGVCALYDQPNSNLRLYCIHYGSQLILLGSGGPKPKSIRTLQENKKLEDENYLLRELSNIITQKMKDGEINLSDMDFEGDLTIYNTDYE